MTEAQVRAVLPGLEKNDRNNDFHAPATTVAGHTLDVGIEMLDGRVAEVSLSSGNTLPNDLEEALTAKYGKPIKPYECALGAFYSCEGDWKAPGGVQVSLHHIRYGGGAGFTTSIKYEAPDTNGL